MNKNKIFTKELIRTYFIGFIVLFFIPIISWLFVLYAEYDNDSAYYSFIEQAIEKDHKLSRNEKDAEKLFFKNNPISSLFDSKNPELIAFKAKVAPTYSAPWQFHLVKKISLGTLIGGIAVVVFIFVLGAVAFINRKWRYFSFTLGWKVLTLVCAIQVLIQGCMLVWLSFWVTAVFWNSYFPKIILLFGILVGVGIFYSITGIFSKIPKYFPIEGELIDKKDAPVLWDNVIQYASSLNTKPPDNIVAGIDDNFYVTESPVMLNHKIMQGRTLYVSIPLLRIMEKSEANAVLAHELAHFSGGDTEASAAIGPTISRFDLYCQKMSEGGLTIFAFYIMLMYRAVVEIAFMRESRANEFRADQTAAKIVSAKGIINSLIKLSAYSAYRTKIEQNLFEQNSRLDKDLGISQRIATGLIPFATSEQFLKTMENTNIPHPYDSHPPLEERMKNVGYEVKENEYGNIITSSVEQTWVSDIHTADEIEKRLWSIYESHFAAAHEKNLAYRYEPANDAEKEIVLKYFPPVTFRLNKDKMIQITYQGLVLPDQSEVLTAGKDANKQYTKGLNGGFLEILSWDKIKDINYTDGSFGDTLEISHPEKGWFGAKKTKVTLKGLSKRRDEFKNTLGIYWQRHQYMRSQQLAQTQDPAKDNSKG